MGTLNEVYTSTGAKMFAHQEAMAKLRNGKGQPITSHVMLTDRCNHSCAFCSVAARAGESLSVNAVFGFIDTLKKFGLKSCILSGGGNPILYRCKETGANFDHVVDRIHSMGLEIGLITNGMPLKKYDGGSTTQHYDRMSWKTVHPRTLDKLTWVRISMAGLDHAEREVYVPDVDPSKTTLGFSYVAHDIYEEPADPHHGKVSTKRDLLSGDKAPDWSFEQRISELTAEVGEYVLKHNPRYVRLLPNCLEPKLIPKRCEQLQSMANNINFVVGKEVAFVQNKPPAAPRACYLGYVHPVLNCDGYVYPCDSCVLNEAADHQFANPWRVCRWDEVAKLYENPAASLIADPQHTCPGCVFEKSNELLYEVRHGASPLPILSEVPEHVNFV